MLIFDTLLIDFTLFHVVTCLKIIFRYQLFFLVPDKFKLNHASFY